VMPSGFPDATCQRFVPGSLRGGAAIHARQCRKAVAAFERSIVSARSPYVRDHFDRDDAAISEAAKRAFLVADALVQDLTRARLCRPPPRTVPESYPKATVSDDGRFVAGGPWMLR
jgi:hypothetical protein